MDKINYLYNAIVKQLNNKWICLVDNETQVIINENNTKKLPLEIVNIILQYDGRIKYKYKQKNAIDYHKFVNVIHKHDQRYNVITPIISKKKKIMKDSYRNESRPNTSFYFEFAFDNQPNLILCYDFNWSYNNVFEICYTDLKGLCTVKTVYV